MSVLYIVKPLKVQGSHIYKFFIIYRYIDSKFCMQILRGTIYSLLYISKLQ
jgi:hypothetical protein